MRAETPEHRIVRFSLSGETYRLFILPETKEAFIAEEISSWTANSRRMQNKISLFLRAIGYIPEGFTYFHSNSQLSIPIAPLPDPELLLAVN